LNPYAAKIIPPLYSKPKKWVKHILLAQSPKKMPRLFSFRFLLLFYPHSRLDVKDIIVSSYHEKLFHITSEDYE